MDTDNGIREHIRRFVMRKFPLASQGKLADGESLLETGAIDSMGILDLVNFISLEFQIEVLDEDLVPQNFDSVQVLTRFVDNKRRGLR